MKRLGTVLVFKPGVTQEEAKRALEQIKELLEEENRYSRDLEEFEDETGWPVWYIP